MGRQRHGKTERDIRMHAHTHICTYTHIRTLHSTDSCIHSTFSNLHTRLTQDGLTTSVCSYLHLRINTWYYTGPQLHMYVHPCIVHAYLRMYYTKRIPITYICTYVEIHTHTQAHVPIFMYREYTNICTHIYPYSDDIIHSTTAKGSIENSKDT